MRVWFFSSLFLFTGCSLHSFTRVGYAPYCLIDYQKKVVDCSYATMNACREQLGHPKVGVCVPGKDIVIKGGK